MSGFDPSALAAGIRTGLYLTLDRPAEDFDAGMRGRVAAFAVEAIVSAWLVGERARVAERLDRAAEWLAQSDAELGDADAEGWFGVQRRRRALAVARWLRGEDPRPAAAGAAQAGAATFAHQPPDAPHELADHLTDWLLAGDAAGAIAAAKAHRPPADDIEATAALRLAMAHLDNGAALGTDLLIATSAMLGQALGAWLDGGAFGRVAAWCRLVFTETGLAGDPEGALLMTYAFLSGFELPPALEERGWREGTEEALVALPSAALLQRVDGLARAVGLARDADAVQQDAEKPTFASWTAQAPGDREIDWHDEDGDCWLELRGCEAGVLAGVLAAALGGRIGRDPGAALADLIRVPRGTGPARLGSNGALRWTMLRQAIAAAVPENAGALNALISAGLSDPDWRVRMTAVLAVGRMRIGPLAEKALAAPAPAAGCDGLGQEDRRMLLALRQAAHDSAAGIPPRGESTDPAIAAKRQAFQARLQARLAKLPEAIEDRADALLLGLLGGRAALNGDVPGAWRSWLD
jgi:hypothetical protein